VYFVLAKSASQNNVTLEAPVVLFILSEIASFWEVDLAKK